MNEKQQNELDDAERFVLKKIFGKESIPDKTANVMQALKIDPNAYVKKFESKISPFMDDDGLVDGKAIKTMLKVWKPSLVDLLDIPDDFFNLSIYLENLIYLLFKR